MKNITVLLLLFFLLAATAFSQTPGYYNYDNGTSYNSFPFNQAAGKMIQTLIAPGEFNQPSGAPAGNITHYYVRISTGYPLGPAQYHQFKLLFSQTALTALPSGSLYTGTWDTVYARDTVTIQGAAQTWVGFTLDHPYAYNPTMSLVVQIEQCSATGTTTGYSLQHTASAVNRRTYSTGGCPFTYGGTSLYVVNCGVDISTAPPNGWVSQTSGVTTSLNTVSAVNQTVGWIGGNGGVVLRTTNGGDNWTNVTGGPIGTADVYCICGLSASTCLVSTSPAATFVYRTTDGGTTWTQVFTQTGGFIDDIKFQNANTGFMYGDPVGARWSLWKSTDAGATWDSTGLYVPQAGTEAGWNNAMWLNGNNLWYGTNNTRVYYSTNFGSSWQFGATTGSANTYSVTFNTGGIGFTGQTIGLMSTDGGANWATATLPGTGTIYSINNVLNRFWYDRGSDIYWSSDNGANFASQYTGTGTYQAMNLTLDGNIIRGWSVTSTGGIAGYYELISGITNNHNQVPSDYALSQNYPNPFNPSTKIAFSLPKAGNVSLVVYDILGREVATLVNEFTTAGNHTIDFNASNLASGVYVYKIQAGDFVDAKKMVLMK